MFNNKLSLTLPISFCLLIPSGAYGSNYTITEIVVPGLKNTVAMAINKAGAIVGFGRPSNGDTVGFLYVNGAFTFLSFPGAAVTQANGMNDAGDIVGTYSLAGNSGSHGFKYSAGSYTSIDAPSPALANTTTLVAINNSGQIAGNANGPNGLIAYVDSGGSFTFLPVPAGGRVTVNGLNDSGEIVGSDGTFSTANAIYGTANSYSEVTTETAFTAVNNGGGVTFGFGINPEFTYILKSPTDPDRGSFVEFAGSPLTVGHGLSDAGTVVGAYFESNSISHAFIATITGPGPKCAVTGISGPPRQVTFTVQDVSSGLNQITARNSSDSNSNVVIPSFTPGTTEPVLVTATATDPSNLAIPGLSASNLAGGGTNCVSQITPGPAVWTGPSGKIDSNVSVGTNQGGALEAFGVGTDGALWHRLLLSGAQWVKLGSVPEALTGDPIVFSGSNGTLQILITSGTGTLWNIVQPVPDSWNSAAWQSVQSGVKGNAAVVVDAAGVANAFIRAADNSVEWLTQQTSSSSAWSVAPSLGGVLTGNPATILDPGNNVHVYAVGQDNALWESEITPSGTVVPWVSVGGSLKGDPVVISSAHGNLYAFGRGTDESLWMDSRVSGGNWGTFASLGGVLVNNPRAATNSDGRVEVFVAGSDSAVWHRSQVTADSQQWTDWATLGGVIVGDVFPIVNPEAILGINVLGSDRSFWQLTQPLPNSWR